MIYHSNISNDELLNHIKRKIITLGGNQRLKIYGTLHCSSGKRMKMANRVFFTTIYKAEQSGYRPCGHCMKAAYKQWKQNEAI